MSENFEELVNDYLPENQKLGSKLEGTIIRKEKDFSYLSLNNKLEGRIYTSEIQDLEIGEKIKVQLLRKEEDFLIVSKNILERNELFNSLNKNDCVTGEIIKEVKGGYKVKIGLIEAFLPAKFSKFKKNTKLPKNSLEFVIVDKNKKEIILSRLPIIEKEENNFINSINLNEIITGSVEAILDFGLIINLGPLNALLHKSELSWDKSLNLNDFKIGEKISAKVIELSKDKKSIKLSLKQVNENPWIEKREKYKVGQNFDVNVKEILNFGLVVSLGEDEGFIHISDIYYKNISSLSKEYKVGDLVCSEIIEINDDKERISLSSKKVFEKIWDDIENFYNINDVTKIKVISIKDFGLFGRTEENLEVFVPKSEYSWNKNEKLDIKINDTIDVKLIEINKDEKNILGSIRKLGISPYEIASSKFSKNTEYELIITDILENGLLVKLTDDFKALIPKKEISNENIKDLSERYNVGDIVNAIIIEKNSNKNSIILSIKKLEYLKEKKELEDLMKIYGANE